MYLNTGFNQFCHTAVASRGFSPTANSTNILPLLFNQRQAPSNDMGGLMGLMMMLKLLKGKPQAPQITVQQAPVQNTVVSQSTPAAPPVNPQIRPQTPDGPNLATYMNTAQWWFNAYNGGRPELSLDTFVTANTRDGGGWAIGGNAGLLFKDADRDGNGTISLYEFAKGCERGDMNRDGRNDTADAMGYAEKLRADGTAKLLGVV